MQRSVDDALKGLRAPKKNALTDLQRQLNKGELDLAGASRKLTAAQKAAGNAERALTAVRRDASSSTEKLAKAEEAHRVSLLKVAVAADNVKVAEERVKTLHEKIRQVNRGLLGDNDLLGRSFSKLGKSLLGLTSGLAKTIGITGKVALIGTAAAGAVAGVTSLTVGALALASALGQAAGAAGLLPAVLAGKWAVVGAAKLALVGFDDALKAVASGDAAKLDEALKKLAPNARKFVREINKAKPAFDAMRMDVQQRAFAGLAKEVQPLAQLYLPIANSLFGSLADTMNRMARDVVNFALSSEAIKGVTTTSDNLKTSFANLAPALRPAVQALLNVVSVGSTFLPKLSSGFADAITGISQRISKMAQSGELQAFFQRALDTIAQLGRIASNVGATLSGIFRAARAAGGGFLSNLESITASMARFVNSAKGQSALTSFFAAMHTIIQALLPVIQALAVIFGTVLAPIIAQVASVILPALLPLLSAMGKLIQAAAPFIQAMAEAFAQLLVALTPVIDAFAQALTDVMPQLTPVIAQIADALIQLITACIPLVPLFVQLLAAILPILPPLIQLAAALIPPLIAIIQALMPIIQALASAFIAVLPAITALVQVISAILVPAIRVIGAVIGAVVHVAVAIFNGFVSFIAGAIHAIAGFFGWFAGLAGRIGGWFGRMVSAAASAIGRLISWVAGIPGKILHALGNLGSLLLNAGKNVIMGLINGLASAAGAVFDWIKNLLSNLKDAVLSFFGIGSPSKMFHEIGMNLGQGLANGIRDSIPNVTKTAEELAAQASRAARLRPLVDIAASTNLTPALVPAAPGTTPAGGDGASADEVADKLADALTGVQVVISETAVTNSVNRRNRLDKRR